MSGVLTVTDDRVDELIHFSEEIGARSPGWFSATCELCDVSTTGSEPTVEDWAYEHIRENHPISPKWEITKCKRGRKCWHVYAPYSGLDGDIGLDWEFRTGDAALEFVRGQLKAPERPAPVQASLNPPVPVSACVEGFEGREHDKEGNQ